MNASDYQRLLSLFCLPRVLLVARFIFLVIILNTPITDTAPAFVAATTASITPLVPDSNLAISNTPMGLQNTPLNFQCKATSQNRFAMRVCRLMSRFWLLLGVEDTVEVKQLVTKGQKDEDNNKNNRFVRRSSIVTYPVSSTPRRSLVWIIG